jgi:hypothetical protein
LLAFAFAFRNLPYSKVALPGNYFVSDANVTNAYVNAFHELLKEVK